MSIVWSVASPVATWMHFMDSILLRRQKTCRFTQPNNALCGISNDRAHSTKSLCSSVGARRTADVPMLEGEPIEINSISLEIIMMELPHRGNFLPVAPSAKTVNETLLDFVWWQCVRSPPSAVNSQLFNLLWLLKFVHVLALVFADYRRVLRHQYEATLVLCIYQNMEPRGTHAASTLYTLPTYTLSLFSIKDYCDERATHCVWKFLMRKCPKWNLIMEII